MSTILPPWPHTLFAVLEPISVITGWYFTLADPHYVVSSQAPTAPIPEILPLGIEMITQQLGNLYLLLAFVGIAVLYSTSEPKVVRNYFVALALGDVGHLYMTYLGNGWEYFVNAPGWNAMAWGNIGFTLFLLINRLAYFVGVFGSPKLPPGSKIKQ